MKLTDCSPSLRRRIEQQIAIDALAPTITAKSLLNETKPDRPLPNPKPKRDQAPALGSTVPGKAKSHVRTIVRFVGYRVRPLDPDNFAGGVKDLLDGLRHARIISGDEPWEIILQTEQVKVSTFKEERTEIEIELP